MPDFEKTFRRFLETKALKKAEHLLAESDFDERHRAFHRSRIFLEAGDHKSVIKTLQAYTQDLSSPNQSAGMLQIFGAALLHLNEGMRALPYLERACELDKSNLTAKTLWLNGLLDTADFRRSLALCEETLSDHPSNVQFLLGKAASLKGLLRPIDSLAVLEETLKLYPENRVAKRLQADIIAESDSRLGLALYKNILATETADQPEVQLRWNSCIHFLRAREFAEGWRNWELGFHKDIGTMGRRIPAQLREALRADTQAPVEGHWTLVCAEQGIGDQVFFLSAFSDLLDEYKNVLVAAEHRMLPILRRSFPGVSFTTPGIVDAWSRLPIPKQGWIPMGSLLSKYRMSPEDFRKKKSAYLVADKDKVAKYRHLLQSQAAGRPIIGISWRGGYWELQQANKAMTLSDWRPLTNQNVLCVNLQYGDVAQEVGKEQAAGASIATFPELDFKANLDDWLALAGACDGVISVSTALVHFAGAVGQKVGVVMPEPQGPWHLGLDDEWHMAYENVYIFRRGVAESDHSLMQRVAGTVSV